MREESGLGRTQRVKGLVTKSEDLDGNRMRWVRDGGDSRRGRWHLGLEGPCGTQTPVRDLGAWAKHCACALLPITSKALKWDVVSEA